MRRLTAVAAAFVLTAASAWAGQAPEELLPRPQEVLGWSIARDTRIYDGGSIEDLPGELAGILADYHFVSGADAVYAGPGNARLSVSVFRLASTPDASGLHWYLGDAANADRADIGQGARIGSDWGTVWRGPFAAYLKVEEQPVAASVIRDFLSVVARRAREDGFFSDLFLAVDIPGYVEDSARYLHTHRALQRLHFISEENVLELTRDTEMIIASFNVDGLTFEGFLIRYPTANAAISAASSYALFLGREGEAEAAWFRQWGRVIAGTWAGEPVAEAMESDERMYATIQEMMRQIRIFQLQR